MFSKKKGAPKKRSWELDADDDQPSEEFLKLQAEIAEREKLVQENAAAAAAARDDAKRVQQEQEKELAESEAVKPCDSQAAYLAPAPPPAGEKEGTTIKVENFHPRTRIHELKQHFLQFGDLVEIALLGKHAFVTFDRAKDANDALLDGAAAPLNGKRLSISAAPPDYRPSSGFHGPSRWHRDDAIKKKEGMMAEREARHEFNKREAQERRQREKEQLQREKERAARLEAEEAARREAAEARALLEEREEARPSFGGNGGSDRGGDSRSFRRRSRSRSRSRDRGRHSYSSSGRDGGDRYGERRERSESYHRRSRSRSRSRDRSRR